MSGANHNSNSFLNKQKVDKIGNTIIYLATHINDLYITKLLKLIYLLDELSIKERGIPFLGLKYKVWQAGPVNRDLYIDINEGVTIFKNYFTVTQNGTSTQIITDIPFNDDEFSDSDIALLDRIVDLYKFKTGPELVSLTHRPSSLWYKKAKETGLLESFNDGTRNSSDRELSMEDLLIEQEDKLKIYREHIEFQKTINSLQK